MKYRPLILLLILITFSCEDLENAILENNAEIVSVSYGTYFGECQGYCNRSIEVEGTDVDFKATGWSEERDYPDINIQTEITQEEWENITEKIDIIIFRNMEEVIGCPDCTDGGAEWIEIETNLLTHKVTFDYGDAPEEIQEYVEELASIMASFDNNIN